MDALRKFASAQVSKKYHLFNFEPFSFHRFFHSTIPLVPDLKCIKKHRNRRPNWFLPIDEEPSKGGSLTR